MTIASVDRTMTVKGLLEAVAAAVSSVPVSAVDAAAELLVETWRHDGVVLAFGNGGSAATASHIACDFTKNAHENGIRPLRCLALSDNPAILTAIANDASYDRVFADQLQALARPGDLALAISVSGTSPSILRAVEAARQAGLPVVALPGAGGGALTALATVLVEVASRDFGWVETAHLGIEHMLVRLVGAGMRRESGGK